MIITKKTIDDLLAQAKKTDRLRVCVDLRTTAQDTSQRILNALMPGTQVPIHRHRATTETVIILYGSVTEIFYDDMGQECGRYELCHESGNVVLQIPPGQWHTVLVNEPCVIFEAKDGAYAPQTTEDIWSYV